MINKCEKHSILLLLVRHFVNENIEKMIILRMTVIIVSKRNVDFGLTLGYADLYQYRAQVKPEFAK